MDLPLFPLHTVLCPGVALPLHVFEDRYKTMVERCLAHESPFGVVLIREGREAGPGELAVAGVGTVAEIRGATRHPDGRYDLITLGTQRFRLEGVDPTAEPYLVGQITPLSEVLGEAGRARLLGERVVQLFIIYLELLQVDDAAKARDPRATGGRPATGPGLASMDPSVSLSVAAEAAGEPWAIDPGEPADAQAAAAYVTADEGADEASTPDSDAVTELAAAGGSPEDLEVERAREVFLDEAARRLTIPDDPTVLSHLLSGIVQVESIRRQGLLEMPTTELRLEELAHLLEREISLLERGLGTYTADPRLASLRRN